MVAPPATLAPARPRAAPADFVALTKPGITTFIVITTAAGFGVAPWTLASGGTRPAVAVAWTLAHLLLGTALVSGGANALNQVAERDVDALMRRTRARPLPAGRLTTQAATWFAWTLAAAGAAELAAFVNPLTAALALLTLAIYVFAYTPLKRTTSLSTLVGAVPGALPVLGGWAAATGSVSPEAVMLFAIMFLWQMPHFLALSWIHREDYARAGMRVLSVGDPDGGATFRQAALNAAALVPVSAAPGVLLISGSAYVAGALLLSGALLLLAMAAAREPSGRRARRLFLATLAYLPALFGLLVATRLP